MRTATGTDADVACYALRLGDDALIHSQRLCEWAAAAPQLEEDVALLNLALDLLGQARALLSLAGTRDGTGRDEDALAFRRDEGEFTNALLFEIDNGDFGQTMARQLLAAAWQVELWGALSTSTDADLAAIAGRAVKEARYHLRHAHGWVVRLGDGTAASHTRMQAGLAALWPFTAELFEGDPLTDRLHAVGIAPDPAALRPGWDATIGVVLQEATLTRPTASWTPGGGRHGRHTEAMGYLLAELQHLHRSHPGARW